MAVPNATYIRVQATVAAVINVVLNPLIEWVLNRERGFQPIWGSDGVVVNMALTSIILSVLVALFAARGVRHELATGRIATTDKAVRASRLLLRLPGRAGRLGLLLGIGAAIVVAVALWLLHIVGVSGLSFGGLLTLKAVYCGVLSFIVARWTILRQLAAAGGAPFARPSRGQRG